MNDENHGNNLNMIFQTKLHCFISSIFNNNPKSRAVQEDIHNINIAYLYQQKVKAKHIENETDLYSDKYQIIYVNNEEEEAISSASDNSNKGFITDNNPRISNKSDQLAISADSQSLNRRRLLQDIYGNTTMTIATYDTQTYNIISKLKLNAMELEFEEAFAADFGLKLNVNIFVNKYVESEKKSSTTTLNPLWYIVVVLLFCVCVVATSLIWYCRRSYKLHQKVVDEHKARDGNKNKIKTTVYHNQIYSGSVPPMHKAKDTIDFGIYKMETMVSRDTKPTNWYDNKTATMHSVEMVTHNKLYGFKNNQHDADLMLTDNDDAASSSGENDTTSFRTDRSKVASAATIAEQQSLMYTHKTPTISDANNYEWQNNFDQFYHQTMKTLTESINSEKSLYPQQVPISASWKNVTNTYNTAMNMYNQQVISQQMNHMHQKRESNGIKAIEANTVHKLADRFNENIQHNNTHIMHMIPQHSPNSPNTMNIQHKNSSSSCSASSVSDSEDSHDSNDYSSDNEQDEKTIIIHDDDEKTVSIENIHIPIMDSNESEEDILENVGKRLSFQNINCQDLDTPISTGSVVMNDDNETIISLDISRNTATLDVHMSIDQNMIITDDELSDMNDMHLNVRNIHAPRQTTMEFKQNLTTNIHDASALMDDIVNDMAENN